MTERYLLSDAVKMLSESEGIGAKAVEDRLCTAAFQGTLQAYELGGKLPITFVNESGTTTIKHRGTLVGGISFMAGDWRDCLRPAQVEVYAEDLNKWLEQNWQRLKFRFGIITDTLFDSRVSEREFGSYVLHVPSLLKWAELKGLHFPPIDPPVKQYKFAQVEALLCAIERVCSSMTNEQAFNIVKSNPELKGHKAARAPDTARWLLGADAHVRWKSQIAMAINHRELTLVDYPSLSPISAEALKALLASLPEVNQSSASDAGQAGDVQVAAESLQTQANSEDGETNAMGLIGQRGRQAKTNKRLSHINATNRLGDEEKNIMFASLEEAQASIVLRYAALQADTRLNNNDAVLAELHRLIGCDTLRDPLYSLKSLKSNITKWRPKT